MTTDTPRTDAVIQSPNSFFMVRVENLCRELERELAAEIANREKCCRDGNAISDELFDTQQKLKKAEAEVERLREWVRSEWPADQAEEIINNCKSK